MRHRTIISLTAFLAVLLCSQLAAQDWAGAERAQGVVVDQAEQPIEGAIVKLRYELSANSEGGPKPLTTNKKGKWNILGLKPGTWIVDVEAEGYISRNAKFTVFDTGVNETVKIELPEIPEEVKDAERRSRANELLASGNLALTEGRLLEARSAFEQVLELVPEGEHAPILAGIAGTYLTENAIAAAIPLIDKALAIDPNEPTALRHKIAVLAVEGNEEEAQQYIARLPAEVELDPNAEMNLGIKRYNEGNMAGAGAIFERVRNAHPEIPEARYYCGLVYLASERNEEALAEFQEFLRLAPEHEKAGEVNGFVEYLAQVTAAPTE